MILLDAINICLRGVGEGRVQNVDSTHPSVDTAKALINEAQDLILSGGLWFNTEYSVNLPKDVNGEVHVPLNTISVTAKGTNKNLLLRGTKLYDPVNNTTDLTELSDVQVDYIFKPDFDDLPALAQQAIAYRAASDFIGDDDGDDVKYRRAYSKANQSAITLATEDIRQKRLNALSAPATARVRIGMTGGRGLRTGDTIGGRYG